MSDSRHSGHCGVISVFARAARLEINPLFVSPLAKGEIQWGFWASRFAGMTEGARSLTLTPQQAGEIFSRVAPKLAVYNHLLLFGGARAEDLIPATRKNYSGPLLVGEDLLSIEIGETVAAHRFGK